MRHPRSRTRPPARVVPAIDPIALPPASVARRFRAELANGAKLTPAGLAKDDPDVFLSRRYLPRYELELFDARYFLTDMRFDDALGFLVGYVQLGAAGTRRARSIYPRIFYKDSSLVWRVGSHFVHDEDEYWIGKGDLGTESRDGSEYEVTVEETTNLPFEIQFALDEVSRRKKRIRDDDAIELVLRNGGSGRIAPYADFTRSRRAASARYAINGDRPIASFTRKGDPASLKLVRGFEPDFKAGVLEKETSMSKFFGGRLLKVRVLSVNRAAQYLFFASPTHVWVNPPQALSTEISTFGVRTIDVHAHDDLCVPGYEYHEEDESQIPDGYAGEPHPKDPHRSDASAWLNELPIVQQFRREVLGEAPKRRREKGRRKARGTR